ncbi:MAG: DsbA family protein [Alphaproteobacteria bacterium]|nr:DsbA family protein [Alphaproteobacteria bacterium]MBV9693827.1 DsbA family protein [Alphaproteobacteria bacterium]
MSANWKSLVASAAVAALVSVAVAFAMLHWSRATASSDRQIHSWLVAHPEVLFEMQAAYQRKSDQRDEQALKESQAAVDRLGLKTFFDPRVAFVSGPANARNSVVEFFDYNCAHCRNTFPAVMKFYEAHKADTRFAFIELPIFGPASNNAARSALAARRQPDKYVAFHFALMSQRGAIDPANTIDAAKQAGLDVNALMAALKDPAVDVELNAAHALAERIKLDGTPLFIVNGKVHSGEIALKELEQLTGH